MPKFVQRYELKTKYQSPRNILPSFLNWYELKAKYHNNLSVLSCHIFFGVI